MKNVLLFGGMVFFVVGFLLISGETTMASHGTGCITDPASWGQDPNGCSEGSDISANQDFDIGWHGGRYNQVYFLLEGWFGNYTCDDTLPASGTVTCSSIPSDYYIGEIYEDNIKGMKLDGEMFSQ